MEIDDIFSLPEKMVINKVEYKYEFDNKGYATLQALIQKGLFKIRDLLLNNDLIFEDCIELVCAGLIKHHTSQEIEEVRKQLNKHLGLISEINEVVIKGFLKGIMPPEVYLKMEEIKEKMRKAMEEPVKKKKSKRQKNSTGSMPTQ